jgi:hypothetical protein
MFPQFRSRQLSGAFMDIIFWSVELNLFVQRGNFNRDVNLNALLPFLQLQNAIVSNAEMQDDITLKVVILNECTLFVESRGRFRIEGNDIWACRWTLCKFLELICRRGVTSVA